MKPFLEALERALFYSSCPMASLPISPGDVVGESEPLATTKETQRSKAEERQETWRRWSWLLAHRLLLLLCFAFLVVVPVISGLLVYLTGDTRVFFESLLGRWPDPNVPKGYTVSREWIGIGVAIGAFALFGAPTFLGALVILFLEHAKGIVQHARELEQARRRLEMHVMSMSEALSRRDDYLKGVLAIRLRRRLGNALPVDQYNRIAEDAVDEAAREWRKLIPPEALPEKLEGVD